MAPALPLFVAGPNARLNTVCEALFQFLNFSGRYDESRLLNQQAEARALAADDHYNAGWRAYNVGWIATRHGDADAMLACADRAAEHWQAAEAGAPERSAFLQLRGHGYLLKEDYTAAIAAYREGLDLDRSLSAESKDVSTSLNYLANAEQDAGDFVAAERDYREALRVARMVGFAEGVAAFTGNLAALVRDREDWPGAETFGRDALTLAEKLGRQDLIAHGCSRLARALVRQGKPAER